MVKSEQQRQRKLAKKKTKERESKKVLAQQRQQMASLSGQMAVAAVGPIERCYISSACHDGTGIGPVILVRRLGAGQYMVAVFLVDVFCLGVKDVVGRKFSPTDMHEMIAQQNSRNPLKSVSPGIARGFVEAAIDYAMSFGIAPHSDYRKVSPLWGDVQPEPVPAEYQFGHDGKPHFVAGPYDDVIRQKQVVQALVANAGEGNFHYSAGGSALNEILQLPGFLSSLDDNDGDFDEDEDEDEEDNEDPGILHTVDGVVSQRHATSE